MTIPVEGFGRVVVLDGKERIGIDVLALRFQSCYGLINMFSPMNGQPVPDLTAGIHATNELALRVQQPPNIIECIFHNNFLKLPASYFPNGPIYYADK